jgi:uncharacterized membrane protein
MSETNRVRSLDFVRGVVMVLMAIFLVDVAGLYVACRWFAKLKARRQERWLRYL